MTLYFWARRVLLVCDFAEKLLKRQLYCLSLQVQQHYRNIKRWTLHKNNASVLCNIIASNMQRLTFYWYHKVSNTQAFLSFFKSLSFEIGAHVWMLSYTHNRCSRSPWKHKELVSLLFQLVIVLNPWPFIYMI